MRLLSAGATCSPATSIEFVGYNEDLYQLLMEKKAYEYKTSSYEGRVWEGGS